MYRESNDRLLQCTERRSARAQLRRRVEVLRAEEEQQQVELQARLDVLSAEQRDVQKLEGVSLTSLFVRAFGDREARLDKERQEAALAQLRAEEQQRLVEGTQSEIGRLNTEIEALGDVDGDYARAFEDKRASLTHVAPAIAEKVRALGQELGEQRAVARELQEAVAAGVEAQKYLGLALKSLRKASNMATWDLLGGGAVVDLVKHGHLDAAKNQVVIAQRWLHRFRRELADVGGALEGGALNLDGLATFADYFFDGFLADLYMRSKIDKSQKVVHSSAMNVNAHLQQLGTTQSQVQANIAALDARYVELVRQA